MLNYILHNLDRYPLDGVVHFELEIDYPFIHNVIDYMETECKRAGIQFVRIKPRKTWEELYDKCGFPTRKVRWCNGHYKLDAKRQLSEWLNEVGFYVVNYIGYCADEERRFNKRLSAKKLEIYPLAENGINEDVILEWAKTQPIFNNYYKTNKRCGCMYCPMSSYLNFAYLYKYYPENFRYMLEKMRETEELREKELGKLLNTRVAALRLQELGIHYTSSLLLTGKPGTGKTELARYIAHVADLPFVVVKFSGIISSSLGQTQTNIGNMFDYAKRTPCVLCIDEIDALGTMRGKKDDVAEMSRVVISLMQELDNIKNDVIVIGTTNRPDQLDEALIRRFVQRHEVKSLNQDDIRELVRKFNDSVGYPMDDIQMDVFCSQFGIEATANTVISACTERIIEKITEEVKQEQA